MARRFDAPSSVLLTLLAVFGLVQFSMSPEGQETPARNVWGHQNLEGIWLDVYETPFERPIEFGDREFTTSEERSTRDQARIGNAGRDRRGPSGSPEDVSGAYNAVYSSVKPAGPRTSLVVDPPNGRIPPLTLEAQRNNDIRREWRVMLMRNTPTCEQGALGCEGGEYGTPSTRRFEVPPFYNTLRMNRHDGPEDQSLGDRCMLGATPDFNGFRRIVQGEDSIAIGYDTGQGQGFQRVVYLNGSHPSNQIRLRHGDSRGRWEGDTLAIETTNFSPKFPFRDSAENRRLVERYTRIDIDTLAYEITIEDPSVWTTSWTVRQELKRQNNEQNRIYYEPRCHEGNYGLAAMFIASRIREKEFSEGRGPDPFSLDTTTGNGGAR